jgi:hypothetical protein
MTKRGKAVIKKDFITKDIYNFYKESNDNPVPYETFRDSSYIISLPRLGDLYVKKYKPKIKFKPNGDLDIRKSHIRIDWGNTLKLWRSDPEAKEEKRKVYHLNKHSKGYLYKFIWDKRKQLLPNKSVYRFKPVRKVDRELSYILKTGLDVDYFEINY